MKICVKSRIKIKVKKKENTAAGISPKSQKDNSSMIGEHMIFVFLYMCVNVFVLLVTHDEYEHKMELVVFPYMAA